MDIQRGSGPLRSGPTGPGSGFSVMPFEMGRFRKADWSQKKRPKFRKRVKKSFEKEDKMNLALSDKGSWFDQESLYTEEGSASELDESDEEDLNNQESAAKSSEDLYLISLSLQEAQLNATAVCKECHSDFKIVEDNRSVSASVLAGKFSALMMTVHQRALRSRAQ